MHVTTVRRAMLRFVCGGLTRRRDVRRRANRFIRTGQCPLRCHLRGVGCLDDNVRDDRLRDGGFSGARVRVGWFP